MGKAKKLKVSKHEIKQSKVSLLDQIEEERAVKSKNRNKTRIRNDEDEEVTFIFYNFVKINIYFISTLHIIYRIL